MDPGRIRLAYHHEYFINENRKFDSYQQIDANYKFGGKRKRNTRTKHPKRPPDRFQEGKPGSNTGQSLNSGAIPQLKAILGSRHPFKDKAQSPRQESRSSVSRADKALQVTMVQFFKGALVKITADPPLSRPSNITNTPAGESDSRIFDHKRT